jgi:hypothetical protein
VTLDELLDRLIPDDGSPGAQALGIADAVAALVPELDALLERIETGEDLETFDASGDPALAALVATAHAVFYADPRSWAELGYTTNVPGRP